MIFLTISRYEVATFQLMWLNDFIILYFMYLALRIFGVTYAAAP